MAKANAAKGAKKGRRFGRPRTAAEYKRTAERKAANKLKNFQQQVANAAKREMGIPTAWEAAKAKRYAKRHP